MKRWFVLLFGVFCYGLFTVLLDFTTALLIVPVQPATNCPCTRANCRFGTPPSTQRLDSSPTFCTIVQKLTDRYLDETTRTPRHYPDRHYQCRRAPVCEPGHRGGNN